MGEDSNDNRGYSGKKRSDHSTGNYYLPRGNVFVVSVCVCVYLCQSVCSAFNFGSS